jgi:hypothetical protein
MKKTDQRKRRFQAIIAPSIAGALGSGFHKKRLRFERNTDEVIQVVEVQQSQYPQREGEAEFTVNLYCLATPLIDALPYYNGRIASNTSHWFRRLGDFSDPPCDRWWHFIDDESAKRAAHDIADLLKSAKTTLDKMTSTRRSIEYWVTQQDWGGAPDHRERILEAAEQWLKKQPDG